MSETTETRRGLLRGAGMLAASAALVGCSSSGDKEDGSPAAEKQEIDVSPTEDLMREHGALNRVLLVFEEGVRRLEAGEEAKPEVLSGGAKIIRRFIEEYHEKLEEEHIFPRFEKAGQLVDLVKVLREQHVVGRRVTERILTLSPAAGPKDAGERAKLVSVLRAYIRMYRAHETREDTVLFPALHGLVTPKEWDVMGDLFEDKEHALFGKDGFEGVVVEVAALEKAFGIDDLSRFTPSE